MKKLSVVLTVASVASMLAVPAMAAIDVSSAAGTFTTDFAGGAAVIGGAMIAAGFIAVVYKWVKAMIFG